MRPINVISLFNGMNTGTTHLLKTSVNNKYKRATLSKNGKIEYWGVHVLVAINFLDHTPCGHELVVDHIDLNKMNNRFDNFRIVTNRVNSNKKHIKSSSLYTGVSWDKKLNKWRSAISYNGKTILLGFFDSEIEASNQYEKALYSIENNLEIEVIKSTYSSQYKGVSWHKSSMKWRAFIVIERKTIHLGTFVSEIDAYNAYLLAHEKHIESIKTKNPLD